MHELGGRSRVDCRRNPLFSEQRRCGGLGWLVDGQFSQRLEKGCNIGGI